MSFGKRLLTITLATAAPGGFSQRTFAQKLGGMAVVMLHHPGHTQGSNSFCSM